MLLIVFEGCKWGYRLVFWLNFPYPRPWKTLLSNPINQLYFILWAISVKLNFALASTSSIWYNDKHHCPKNFANLLDVIEYTLFHFLRIPDGRKLLLELLVRIACRENLFVHENFWKWWKTCWTFQFCITRQFVQSHSVWIVNKTHSCN